jgi:DNA-binding NarL/FixJ family response regulator
MKTLTIDQNSWVMERRARPRVFIADHSAAVIERLVASIDGVAQVIGRATNARDAISGIRNGNPHLTVFDIGIANGIDLLRQIKNHQPPVIVVILTHSAEEPTRRRCLHLGAEYFLDKIYEFDKVREIVIAISSGWGRAASDQPVPH